MAELNDKQQRFCEEYIIDFNGAQAAIRAGYSKKTARSIAQRLLTKADIQEQLFKLKKELQEKTGITKEKVLREFARIAFFDIRKIFTVDGGLKNIHDFDDESAAAVAGIESYDEKVEDVVIGTIKKVKISDKNKALESLAKHLGLFEKDNAQQKPDVQPIVFYIPENGRKVNDGTGSNS